jgi:Domain of unknown function (DUF4411)
MASGDKVYCFDTSSLVHAWRRAYPPKRFSRLWAFFDDLIEGGRMVASIEVLNELKKKDDDVFEWAKVRKESMFREIDDEIQDQIGRIMAEYPRLVDTKTGKSGGDPFVIAQAMIQSPYHIIVTEEQGGSSKSPKIPYVCIQEGVRHINLLTLIEEEDWSFS